MKTSGYFSRGLLAVFVLLTCVSVAQAGVTMIPPSEVPALIEAPSLTYRRLALKMNDIAGYSIFDAAAFNKNVQAYFASKTHVELEAQSFRLENIDIGFGLNKDSTKVTISMILYYGQAETNERKSEHIVLIKDGKVQVGL